MKISSKKIPNWTGADLDGPALLGQIQDLGGKSNNHQAFLLPLFALGEDILELYKSTINYWVCPDVMRNQDMPVAMDKKAISDYQKALWLQEGGEVRTVFNCGSCMNLLGFFGLYDAGFLITQIRMFKQALKAIVSLEASEQDHSLVEHLERVRHEGNNFGLGRFR